jgi:hypothetical protein
MLEQSVEMSMEWNMASEISAYNVIPYGVNINTSSAYTNGTYNNNNGAPTDNGVPITIPMVL